MNAILFGIVAGAALAFAGANFADQPLRTTLLLSALVIAHIAFGV